MSWDVFLMSTKLDLSAKKTPNFPPLGDRKTIMGQLKEVLPEMDYSNPDNWLFRDGVHSIEFGVGNQPVIKSIMLRIRGGGDPINIIEKICTTMGWYALDCGDLTYMEFDQRDQESFDNWRNLRDGIARESASE